MMEPEQHKKRHTELHRALDELVADFITYTGKRPSQSTVLELMEWSAKQMHKPTPEEAESAS